MSTNHLDDPRLPADDDSRDACALAALDALDGPEASRFDSHLRECGGCRAEVDALRSGAVDPLAQLGARMEPPAGLRARVLAAVAAAGTQGDESEVQPWKGWSSSPGDVLLLGALSTGWEPTSIEGIETRPLFVDEKADRVTMLVRMAPGTSYPSHRHAGPEECFVLEGDLDVGAALMTAGSYQRLDRGTAHPIQSTRSGCVLLLVSSMHDELLAS